MSRTLNEYDAWLTAGEGPAALVLREHLMPVEGHDGVVFPPTFAAGDGFPGGYNIDTFGDEGENKNSCIIDTFGSQANRIEPIFATDRYCELIPQVVVKAGEKTVNLVEAGHRAGDALMRSSGLQQELQTAFKAVLLGDAEPLAKIAPTSLVFGVWDSRDTQAKLPRLVSSTIRAFDVRSLTRGAVYVPPIDYAELEVFSEAEKTKAEGSSKNPLAQRGFVHNPASGSPGGVIATGGIRRDATLSLAALHLIAATSDERTLALRRYIFALALVALTARASVYLRQGCNLVLDPDRPAEWSEVYRDGMRQPSTIDHDQAVEFADAAAKAFGVGESKIVEFDKARAKADVKKKKGK